MMDYILEEVVRAIKVLFIVARLIAKIYVWVWQRSRVAGAVVTVASAVVILVLALVH